MNNPGIDVATWENLRKKWSELAAAGHKLKIEFQLIADPKDETNVFAIDVVQHVDDDVFTETVQRKLGEAYAILGVEGLSMERLVVVYKKIMGRLYTQQTKQSDVNLVVVMSLNSETSGELYGYVERSDGKTNVLLDYQHYYVLSALREKMVAVVGDAWSKVKAVYESGSLEFYFEY